MKIETIPLADLTLYEHNVKKHPQYQVDQIKQSIVQFGNNDPIAIDEYNTIIEGHGRYLALSQLGYEEVPAWSTWALNKNKPIYWRTTKLPWTLILIWVY